MNNPRSANGISGVLLPSFSGGLWIFRVYHEDGEFTDYDIYHSDLTITINDADAYFYKTKNGALLDHSPQTLGRVGSGNDYLDL